MEKKKKKLEKSFLLPGFDSIKHYAYLLLIVLSLLYLIAFIIFRFVAERQLRYELNTLSQVVKQDTDSDDNLNYVNGLVVLQNNNIVKEGKYKEINIGDNEYLAYAPSSSPTRIFAIPESQIKQDLMLTAIILAVLYLSQVIVLIGWWSLLKDKIKVLFSVK